MQKIELEVIDEFITENFLPSKREAKKKDLVSSLNSAREESDRQSEPTCENCKHKILDTDETSASKGEYYCKIHGKNLTNMFKVVYTKKHKLDFEDIGCRQFEQK